MSTTMPARALSPMRVELLPEQAARFVEALQPGTMGPRLAAALGGPASCHVLDAKYEPGVRAVLLYEHAGQLIRGDLTSPDEGATGELEVPPGVRISRFPWDPELPTLPFVMDEQLLGLGLADALGIRAAVRVRAQLLRYRPGKRATVLARLVSRPQRFVVKTYHDPAKAEAVTDEASALATATESARALRLAPTVVRLPELAAVVQAKVSGTPLDLVVASRGTRWNVRAEAVAGAARALAELHSIGPVTSRLRPVDRELHRFGARAARVGQVDPRLGESMTTLAQRLLDTCSSVPPAVVGTVHGDCKPSQFLLEGPGVYLMDLDHVGLSDPAGDVGTFLASLRQLAVRQAMGRRRGSPGLAKLGEVFLESYLRAGGPGDRRRFRWQEAVALERKALRAFARSPRSSLPGALLAEAQRCLDDVREAR